MATLVPSLLHSPTANAPHTLFFPELTIAAKLLEIEASTSTSDTESVGLVASLAKASNQFLFPFLSLVTDQNLKICVWGKTIVHEPRPPDQKIKKEKRT